MLRYFLLRIDPPLQQQDLQKRSQKLGNLNSATKTEMDWRKN
jgi:hypothetical protein